MRIYRHGSDAPYRKLDLRSLNYPVAIALDSDDDLYAANAGNNTVTVYKASRYKLWYTISDQVYAPQVLALSDSGQLYVGNEPDSGGSYPQGSVTVYGLRSQKLETAITEAIDYPVALALGRHE